MPWPRPSLPDLLRRTAEDLGSRVKGDPFLKRSFEHAISKVVAALTHGLYGHQTWIARQAVPSPDSDEETILQWAALFLDPPRILATRAKGSATFAGTDATVLPEGYELAIGDSVYTVDAEGVVASGEVTVAVTAVRAGAAGNAVEGTRIRLTSPIAGIDTDGEVGPEDITRGTDDEPVSTVFERLKIRLTSPPRGGAAGDWITWMLESREETGVTVRRAWEYPRRAGLGTVGIAFIVEDEIEPVKIPSPTERQDVHDYVLAKAPVIMRELISLELLPVPFEMHLKISPNTAPTRDAVRSEIKDLLYRRSEPETPILHSAILTAITNAGLDDFELVSPTGDVDPGDVGIFVYDEDSITFEAL
jgi:uncharacterized phage protein gp47/JayE